MLVIEISGLPLHAHAEFCKLQQHVGCMPAHGLYKACNPSSPVITFNIMLGWQIAP